MNKDLTFLNGFNLTNEESLEIIDYFSSDTLEGYLKTNYTLADSAHINNWVAGFIFLEFIKRDKPELTKTLTANALGRKLKELGVISRNNHSKIIRKSCGGYYVKAVSNIKHFELIKFIRDYGDK